MRQLRELGDERQAQLLADALSEQGIECDLRPGQNASSVWVHDEQELERATTLTDEWLAEPDLVGLNAAAQRGREAREQAAQHAQREQRQVERVRRAIEAATRPRPTPLTWGLIALCIGAYVLTDQTGARAVASQLWIADPSRITLSVLRLGQQQVYWLSLPWSEPWRFLSPIILHADLLHIVFNMLWLHSLGTVLERRHGSAYLLIFVVLCGALSNVAQYEIGQSPAFGGMSGVVYGLLGLMWIRGRMDPTAGYLLSNFTIQFMLLWLVLGFVMSDMQTANWCHLGGLVVGVVWGALAAHRTRLAK